MTMTITEDKERAQDVERLKSAIAFGAELQTAYDELAPRAKQAKRDRLAYQTQLMAARANLNAAAAPLDPLTFPSEAMLAKQKREVEHWTKVDEELSELLTDARRRESDVLECVRLQNALVQQGFVVNNLRTLAEGGRVGYVEGGLSTSPDLLGNTQMPPR
jgi:hypothetical protein